MSNKNVIYNGYLKKRYALVLQSLPKIRSACILDVGCGDGSACFMYAHQYKTRIVALDITYHSTWKKIKEKENASSIDFLIADANNLPFQEHSFDVVIMTEVLEHLDDDIKYLMSLNKVLKNNGSLIVTTPNGARITSIISRIVVFLKKTTERKLNYMDHRREYSSFELRKTLSKSGFKLKFCAYVSFCPYLFIFRKIPPKKALRLFNQLDNISKNIFLAPLLRWCLIAVSTQCTLKNQ